MLTLLVIINGFLVFLSCPAELKSPLLQQGLELLAAYETTDKGSLLTNAPYAVGLSIEETIMPGFPRK
jgi:hypothetical protein